MHSRPRQTYIREADIHYRRRRITAPPIWDTKGKVGSSREAGAVVRELIGSRVAECMIVLALDARCRVLGFHEVARGGVASCGIDPADVFRYPIAAGSKRLIIAHNHPSGDPTPSDDDLRVTERLVAGAKLLGLEILDHVVVADEQTFSFVDAGLMP